MGTGEGEQGGTSEGEPPASSEHDAALTYSAQGNTRWIVLRGRWGQRVDRFVCRHTGYSLITKQYSLARGQPYQPTLLLTTIGRRSGQRHTRALPYYSMSLALLGDADGAGADAEGSGAGDTAAADAQDTAAASGESPEPQAMVVIGSNGGGPKDPDWVWNVRDRGEAWVRVGRRDLPVDAHVALGEERARLAERIHARRGSLALYEARASTFGREVPLVVLVPRVSPPSPAPPAPTRRRVLRRVVPGRR